VVTTGTVDDLLRFLPRKGHLAAAAQYVGQQPDHYVNLVNESLRAVDGPEGLGAEVEAALINVLPPRIVA
jgi:hypothetical protein